MRHRTTISGEAARNARAAQSDFASLQRAMRAAEATMQGLNRVLKVPHVTPRRRVIKASRSAGPLGFLGNISFNYQSTDTSGSDQSSGSDSVHSPASFYESSSQSFSRLMTSLRLAQRIL